MSSHELTDEQRAVRGEVAREPVPARAGATT